MNNLGLAIGSVGSSIGMSVSWSASGTTTGNAIYTNGTSWIGDTTTWPIPGDTTTWPIPGDGILPMPISVEPINIWPPGVIPVAPVEPLITPDFGQEMDFGQEGQ